MGCSSSRETRGVVSPALAERRHGLRSLTTRAASALASSLGLCRAGHDAAAPPPARKGAGDPPAAAEEAPLAGEGAAVDEEKPPAIDFDPATLPSFLPVPAVEAMPSPSHPALLYPKQENTPSPETKTRTPAIRDIPEVMTGIVRARVDEFHKKLEKRRRKKKQSSVAAEEEVPAGFFVDGDGDDVTPAALKLRRPLPRAGKTVVLYFTSLRGVRRTFEDCRAVRAILRCYRVRLDERDVSMHAAFKSELRDHLLLAAGEVRPAALPRVFVVSGGGGLLHDLGGAEELCELHEAGELARALALAGCDAAPPPAMACAACGEARFVLCGTCHGSCKVFVGDDEGCRRRFAGFFRQCPDCNENGLIRCPV
nr:unnamed protein product [Digitaria exilis]